MQRYHTLRWTHGAQCCVFLPFVILFIALFFCCCCVLLIGPVCVCVSMHACLYVSVCVHLCDGGWVCWQKTYRHLSKQPWVRILSTCFCGLLSKALLLVPRFSHNTVENVPVFIAPHKVVNSNGCFEPLYTYYIKLHAFQPISRG